MINNRQQSGRRRGRGGQRQGGNTPGRPDMGNRIDNRARGNAPQLLEKYKTLARDAQQAGDRVLAEYYLQFADHYFRVLAESRARYEEANPNARRQSNYDDNDGYDDGDSDGFSAEGDGDQGDEFDSPRTPQPQRQYRDDRNERQDRQPRDDRGDRNGNREPRQQREERPRDERPRDERPREDRPRRDAPRPAYADRSNGRSHDGDVQANGRDDDDTALPFDALPPAINAPVANEPMRGVEGEPAALPKKRGRPRKVVTEVPAGS